MEGKREKGGLGLTKLPTFCSSFYEGASAEGKAWPITPQRPVTILILRVC